MKNVILAVVVIALTLVLSSLPASADGSAGIVYTWDGHFPVAVSIGTPLTTHPFPSEISGIVTISESPRIGAAWTVAADVPAEAIAKVFKGELAEPAKVVLKNTDIGLAYLLKLSELNSLKDLSQGDAGLIIKWSAFNF